MLKQTQNTSIRLASAAERVMMYDDVGADDNNN